MRQIAIFLACCTFASAHALNLSQNDMSVLMPLPKTLTEGGLLAPIDQGQYGELLPKALFDQLPPLLVRQPGSLFDSLRVVALRFDPCFPAMPPVNACTPQVRLVWQPLMEEVENNVKFVSTIDVAVHTFYDLPSIEFTALIWRLEQLKASSGRRIEDEALTVNPTLRSFGLRSQYAKTLFATVMSSIGAKRMSRITFMQVDRLPDYSTGETWSFGGLDLSAGEPNGSIQIPRVGGTLHSFKGRTSNALYFDGETKPAPTGPDTIGILITDSKVLAPKDELEIKSAAAAALRIENPKLHSAHTIDCVSCHLAFSARTWAIRHYPWMNLRSGAAFGDVYWSRRNLENTSQTLGNSNVLRGFGYIGNKPAVSQRVVNETAEAITKLYGL